MAGLDSADEMDVEKQPANIQTEGASFHLSSSCSLLQLVAYGLIIVELRNAFCFA